VTVAPVPVDTISEVGDQAVLADGDQQFLQFGVAMDEHHAGREDHDSFSTRVKHV
jgi:hypothetical protein